MALHYEHCVLLLSHITLLVEMKLSQLVSFYQFMKYAEPQIFSIHY